MSEPADFKDRLGQLLHIGDPIVVSYLPDLHTPKSMFFGRITGFSTISFLPKMVDVHLTLPYEVKKGVVFPYECIKIGEFLLEQAMITKLSS